MPLVQFAPFSSLVQPAFWHELTRIKLEVLKLSDDAVPIRAAYGPGRSVVDRETGKEVALGCMISVGAEAFEGAAESKPAGNTVIAKGVFKNYNTVDEFRAADKTAMFNQVSDEIWKSITTSRSPALLNQFLLLTFADLKKYRYYYWFAFPAFAAKPAWDIGDDGWKAAGDVLGHPGMASIHAQLKSAGGEGGGKAYWLARSKKGAEGEYEVGGVDEYEVFFEGVEPSQRIIAFLDPSAQPQNPGWPLRNLLAYLRAVHPGEDTAELRVLCWREGDSAPSEGSAWKSRFATIHQASPDPTAAAVPATPAPSASFAIPSIPDNPHQPAPVPASVSGQGHGLSRPATVGWEKDGRGKMAPRMADLAPMMDPKRLADQAVDLNLKLMRWRILPALDLDKIAETKCLLLGAGTLGCYVARTLMGWGIRTITFVDSARVSFSNPVRQPLFEFEDCLNGGRPKAECAAERLGKIFPGINATGHSLSIPMPGHPISPGQEAATRADVEKLEALVDAHDAVFLLMDSRESRWLPTVLGAAKGKIVMNAALGFDTYLVMRHGARASSISAAADGTTSRLGCYYCNDIVAPSDSLTDRTLDQMCTVTRPGLASIASSTAVELLASLIQHPDGIHAAAPPPSAYTSTLAGEPSGPGASVLGLVPHQLRGFLAQFRTMPIVGAAYDKCTGCSETVLTAYETEGFDMMLKAFNEPGYLEALTGLDKMYEETTAVLESAGVEMDGEEDDF